jgi:chromosomal replication initiator protein
MRQSADRGADRRRERRRREAVTPQAIDVVQAWPAILERVRSPENDAAVRLWLASHKVRPLAIEDGVLVLECPTSLFQDTIRKRFGRQLVEAASEALGAPISEVRCLVPGRALREHEERKLTENALTANGRHISQRTTRGWGHGFKLLESFVVGSCNRLAYDAVMRILENPHNPVNPLFIHGASGLGKTHLEQGLALSFKERYPKSKVEYIRCEQFTNDYIKACKDGTLDAFRVKMRHPDLLLIDDIHFLSQGQMMRTKDELFATFNELSECGKKVVITSDAGPRDIQYLEERFIQRFSGGLVIEMQKPDEDVRREVVHAKARSQDVALSDEVVEYVVDHITDNIRELEGAVNKLVQFGKSFQRRIDLAATRQALADMLDRGAGESQTAMILREVAARFAITVEDLVGRNRSGPRATARHVAMYVLKNASADTYSTIGQVFGVKSHSSVAYACEQVAQYRTNDAALDKFIADLQVRARRA